jgi:Flp pilus assembly protein CpaB
MDFAENLLSSRRGTILVGAAAAILAAILLIVYLSRYRASLKASDETTPVLVAKHFIQKGAPGNIIARTHEYQVASLPKTGLRDGALTDSASLAGLVAAHDIYANQQLTAADFVAVAPGALQTSLAGRDRAISIPIDAAHGMVGQISPGDHVDVYVGLEMQGPGGTQPILKQLIQNSLVLRTPTTGAGDGNVVLRAKGAQAAALAFSADNGKLWLVLRPASGAKPAKPGLVTVQRLLLGVRAVG